MATLNLMPILTGVLTVPFYLTFSIFIICILLPLLFRPTLPLSNIPGPRLAAWTRLWWLKTLSCGNVAQELVKLDRKYGPIVRIAPNNIVVSDPETTRSILSTGSGFTRGPWYDSLRMDPKSTTVVSERDPKEHQRLRYMLSAGLGSRESEIERTVDRHVERWIDIIDSRYTSTSSKTIKFDLANMMPFLALDMISDLCLGESFQCVEKEADPYGFLDALKSGIVAQQYISFLLELKSLLHTIGNIPFCRSFIVPSAKDGTGIGSVMRVIHKAVERKMAKREQSERGAHMLDAFLARGLTVEKAGSELAVVLSSGVLTTSYAAQAIIRCLISHPSAHARVRAEIDQVVWDNCQNESTRPGCPVKNFVINQLPYLQACIMEGLRLYPPVILLREHMVPEGGIIFHGHNIPEGTFVGFNSMASRLHPIYGSDLEEFHPERWLIDDEVRLSVMRRNLELVFGYGSSKCLGINIAYLELNKIIFEFFRNYDVSFINPGMPWKIKGDFLLSEFFVRVERRYHTNGV